MTNSYAFLHFSKDRVNRASIIFSLTDSTALVITNVNSLEEIRLDNNLSVGKNNKNMAGQDI